MKSRMAIVLLAAAGVLSACSHETSPPVVQNSAGCPAVNAVKKIPADGQRGVDAAYDRLRYDSACEPVLLSSLLTREPMRDPRPMTPEPRFVVGDAALFFELARHDIALEAVLPPAVADKLPTQGMSAYFDFMAAPEHRAEVVATLRKKLRVQGIGE